MKRFLSLILAAVMVLCMAVTTPAQDVKPITVTLNGSKVDCESYGSPATIVDGRTLVPLRAIFEALGASVEWDQSSKTVSSELDGTKIKLTVGSSTLYKNGNAVTLDVPASIIGGRTMVPARAIAESYGVDVKWDASSRTVILTKQEKAKSRATLIEDKNSEADIPKITVYRAVPSAEKDENGNVYGLFKGMKVNTPETDYFINYIAKKEVMDKNVVMSIKVIPNDTVKDIVFATGAHVHVTETVPMSALVPDVWNRLTYVYNVETSESSLYINDVFKSSKTVPAQNNTFRILFRFATSLGDSYIYFDDYRVYSGDVAIPAVKSDKYTLENLAVNGYGNDSAGTIMENLTGGFEEYTMTITDKNGATLEGSASVDDTCTLKVLDGSNTIAEYGFGVGSYKFSNAMVSSGGYILPEAKFGKGETTFSLDYRNLTEEMDAVFSAVQYDKNGKKLKSSEEKVKIGAEGTLGAKLNITTLKDTYVELSVLDAKTKEALSEPVRFDAYSSEKIELCAPLYQGFTTKAVCFNYDDAVWQDSILVQYLNKYGIKATFNLQGSNILTHIGYQYTKETGKTDEAGKLEYVKSVYEGHEIACHSMTHIPACFNEGEVGHSSTGIKLVGVDAETLIKDTVDCPAYVREKLGGEGIGLAWPQGYASQRNDYKTKLLPAIREAGIKYARGPENGTFSLPEDWYQWNATCHHRDAVKYTDMFIALENKGEMKCFFNWGHAYEFENNKNNPALGWTMIEGVMQKLAAEENIWKATNGEIYKYVEATKLAEVSDNKVKNNSDMTLYFNINGENVTLGAGQTYTAG